MGNTFELEACLQIFSLGRHLAVSDCGPGCDRRTLASGAGATTGTGGTLTDCGCYIGGSYWSLSQAASLRLKLLFVLKMYEKNFSTFNFCTILNNSVLKFLLIKQ